MRHHMQKFQHVNDNGVIFAFDQECGSGDVSILVYESEDDMTPLRCGSFDTIEDANIAVDKFQPFNNNR